MFVLCDDLGWGELGCYGQEIIKTPNLDRMASEGARFTDFYSAAPICAPSRCSALTGLHQGHARVRHNTFNEIPAAIQADLEPEDVTFGEVAKAGGYATGLFGKWGFGPDDRAPQSVPSDLENEGHFSHPLQKGFDEFNGFIYHHHATNGYWADYWWEGNTRVDISENADGAQGKYMPDEYVSRALDFVDRHAEQPFLLWLSTILPHTPNHVPDWSEYDDLPYANDTKKHAAMITLLDKHVGMLRAKIEELGLENDTIFLFTSDNGPHDETAVYGGTDPIPTAGVTSVADVEIFNSNGPYRGVKQNIYEGGVREPFIAWGPGVLGSELSGTVIQEPFATYDLLPTVADLVGIQPPSDVDGVSLLPLLTGEGDQTAHDFIYWERFNAGAPSPMWYGYEAGRQGKFAQAARKGKWKLIRWAPGSRRDGTVDVNPTGTTEVAALPVKVPKELWHKELYDLEADPGETTDLSLMEPEVVAELLEIIEAEHSEPPFEREPWAAKKEAGASR